MLFIFENVIFTMPANTKILESKENLPSMSFRYFKVVKADEADGDTTKP